MSRDKEMCRRQGHNCAVCLEDREQVKLSQGHREALWPGKILDLAEECVGGAGQWKETLVKWSHSESSREAQWRAHGRKQEQNRDKY